MANQMPLNRTRKAGFIALVALASSLTWSPLALAQSCSFLPVIGGDGGINVAKRVDAPKVSPFGMLLGRTNWNTDFAVNQPYNSYKLFFTAQSTEKARYPITAYLKFSDGTNLQVVNELMAPPLGKGAMFGPFQAVAGKEVSQVNFKIGASADPGSTGFSYRISVQGCN
ncbi:MAG: hypothetical protein ACOYLI_01310 [Synechococcus lacustris]|jgi:hypothetical protein